MKKTTSIKTMIEHVNKMNRESTCDASVRQGWNALLEDCLHAAGAYAGFGYYAAGKVPAGEKPGIIEDAAGNKTFPDETRRFYYVDARLN